MIDVKPSICLEQLNKVIFKAIKFLSFILPTKGVHSWFLCFGNKIQHGEKQITKMQCGERQVTFFTC